MRQWIDKTMHPERYHGHDQRPPFFEGWYYKLISADQSRRYAVIPGIFLSEDRDRHHAFVQVFDGLSGHVTYHRYPPEQFYAARDKFEIRVGPNWFTEDSLSLDIRDDLRRASGEVRFSGLTRWPVTMTAPGIMGWYAWMPFMECYHGVISLDHAIEGGLQIDGEPIDFSGGRGYIEKDWGQAFPSAWVWMQSNHFETPGVSLTASIAMIPFVRQTFPGFIIGLWHDGELHRLATYIGARTTRLEVTDDHVTWVIESADKRLEILAERAEGALLPGPNRVEMGVRVPETLKATIAVRLTRTGRGATGLIFEGKGGCAGLEVAGALPKLLSTIKA